LLQRETADFTTPDLWPPNSPDLTPVDYRICGVLQECIHQNSVKNEWRWTEAASDRSLVWNPV